MKKSLIQLRDDDFVACLRSVVNKNHKWLSKIDVATIIAQALAMKPKRYYLAHDTVLSNIRRSHFSTSSKPSSVNDESFSAARLQWYDIECAVRRHMATHPDDSLYEAINFVINFTRPRRFYISPSRALLIFKKNFRLEYRLIC